MDPRRYRPRETGGLHSRRCSADLAAGAQLPTRFHAHVVRARSRAERLFAGRKRGHVKSIDFCNRKRSVSTPRDGPDSDTHTVACQCRSESSARESDARRAFSGQGLRAFRSRLCPHRDDRSPRWIYPNPIDPDTRCREPVPDAWWKRRAGRPCGN